MQEKEEINKGHLCKHVNNVGKERIEKGKICEPEKSVRAHSKVKICGQEDWTRNERFVNLERSEEERRHLNYHRSVRGRVDKKR